MSDYRFVDPGAYATDQFANGDSGFFTTPNFPIYKGVPTGFATINVNEFSSVNDAYSHFIECHYGAGLIHVYSENPQILNQPLTYFRIDLKVVQNWEVISNTTAPYLM